MKRHHPSWRQRPAVLATCTCALLALLGGPPENCAAADHAATVIDYRPGAIAGSSLINPYAATGPAGQLTGAATAFPSIYSFFSPHYEAQHLIQIGEGGELVLKLGAAISPIAGADEIGLFTNVGLIDGDFPNGLNNAGTFGADPVELDVSPDGIQWTHIGTVNCDFPAGAFTDAPSPFHPDTEDLTAADFTKSHNLDLADLDGLDHDQIIDELDGSAGGNWVDLDPSGLDSIAYLRLRVPDDGDPTTEASFELCAVSINSDLDPTPIPEPLRFVESFADNPLGTRATTDPGHANFTPGQLAVGFDLSSPTRRTSWPLGRTLTDLDSFSFEVEFTIDSADFGFSNFGQLSFGLTNLLTTGANRTSFPSNAWDLLTIDYFPNPDFATFTPTVIGSQQDGDTSAFQRLGFPQGSTSLINDPGEIGELPTDTRLAASIDYRAGSRTITMRLADQVINAVGADPDGDPSTIQYAVPADIEFSVDAFTIACWSEPSGGTADLRFHRIAVATPAPAANYYSWADENIENPLDRAFHLDADADGLRNGLDYALGGVAPTTTMIATGLELSWTRLLVREDVELEAEFSSDLQSWLPLREFVTSSDEATETRRSTININAATEPKYIRLNASRP